MKTVKPLIDLADLDKLDIRLGRITAAEVVPKKKKLMKLTVDFGGETRTIVSGIADILKPDELVGKLIPFILNLPPREFPGTGLTSEGMIVGSTGEDGYTNLNLLEGAGSAVAGDIVF